MVRKICHKDEISKYGKTTFVVFKNKLFTGSGHKTDSATWMANHSNTVAAKAL